MPLELDACYTINQVSSEKVQSSIIPAWWHEFLIMLNTVAPITIG
jgi:hypothetical protein